MLTSRSKGKSNNDGISEEFLICLGHEARIDRSIGAALAVEQLLRDSYIFDTHVMSRPSGNVRVVAAKRDYI
ncbi:unnamed protein product [Strongylus vulgaris]|uniref:Uncharacterized protein n=1 Tax=Strongylus vulgaris TaxID=40348 RepID=A0A3P7J091_STRVU|nr:unnamed protein product [Strongylus vulgaris]